MDRRMAEHDRGLNPDCYTFERRPVILRHLEQFDYIDEAIAREKQLKRWSRKKKIALIQGDKNELRRLSKSHSGLRQAPGGKADYLS